MRLSPRSYREPSPWPNILVGVVIGLFLSAMIRDSNTEFEMNERLLKATSRALAKKDALKQPSQGIPAMHHAESGWHAINVYFGDRNHLPYYSAINKDYFERVQWFSQRRQDFVISKLLKGKRNGYFVDLAANDAVQISNTYALETFFDWDGLCIEPNPEYWLDWPFESAKWRQRLLVEQTRKSYSSDSHARDNELASWATTLKTSLYSQASPKTSTCLGMESL
jgi:hypothetical protein